MRKRELRSLIHFIQLPNFITYLVNIFGKSLMLLPKATLIFILSTCIATPSSFAQSQQQLAHEPSLPSLIYPTLSPSQQTDLSSGNTVQSTIKIESKDLDAGLFYLLSRIKDNQRAKHKEKLAIVLSIDDVALSFKNEIENTLSPNQINSHGRPNNPIVWANIYLRGNGIGIQNIKQLCDIANSQMVKVFFITERPLEESIISATKSNLQKLGYQYEDIYFFPLDNPNLDFATFKKEMRMKLALEGYQTVLNIGHFVHDVVGGYSEAAVVIP